MRVWVLFVILVIAAPAAGVPYVLEGAALNMDTVVWSLSSLPEEYVSSEPTGLATHSLQCGPATVPGFGMSNRNWHDYYGLISSASPVGLDENGRITYVPGTGLDWPLTLNNGSTLDLYLATTDTQAGAHSTVFPNVQIDVELRHSPDGYLGHVDDEAFAAATLMASASSAPMNVMPGAANHERVDGRDVYHWQFELPFDSYAVSAANQLFLRMQISMDVPTCEEHDVVMLEGLRFYTDASHRSRLQFDVQAPLASLPLDVGRTNETENREAKWVLSKRVTTPWGMQDVLLQHASLEGPVQRNLSIDDGSHPFYHCHCYDPGDQARKFAWSFPVRELPPGEYALNLTVTNLQGTATAQFADAFVVPGDVEAPPAPMFLLIGALLAVALLRLRRAPLLAEKADTSALIGK